MGEVPRQQPALPRSRHEGIHPDLHARARRVPAPLELVVDNFNEIEHSGTVQRHFGYDLARMDEVKVKYEVAEDSLRVVNVGPSKRLSWLDGLFVGVRRGDLFHDRWTTWFSPVHSALRALVDEPRRPRADGPLARLRLLRPPG